MVLVTLAEAGRVSTTDLISGAIAIWLVLTPVLAGLLYLQYKNAPEAAERRRMGPWERIGFVAAPLGLMAFGGNVGEGEPLGFSILVGLIWGILTWLIGGSIWAWNARRKPHPSRGAPQVSWPDSLGPWTRMGIISILFGLFLTVANIHQGETPGFSVLFGAGSGAFIFVLGGLIWSWAARHSAHPVG